MQSLSQRRLQAAFSHLGNQSSRMIGRLQEWSNQNSGSYNVAGLLAMSDILAKDFASLGLPVQRFAGDDITGIDDHGLLQSQPSADLLMVQHNPSAERQILLMIHYDTVYPPTAMKARCEMRANGVLRGPGVADAKGGLMIMLEALKTVRMFELDREIGWTLLVNPDEEIGSPASSRWIRENAQRYHIGLLFEPTLPDGSLVSSRKGSGNFTLTVRGRSAHAGRHPELGRNAVVHLSRLLDQLDRLNDATSGINLNVAKIAGGTALNQVPDLAIGRFNVRVNDQPTGRSVLQQIEELVTTFDQADGLTVVLDGEFQSPPKMIDEATMRLQKRVERACELAGRSVNWRATGGACDGSKLAAAGLTNIDTMGPTGDCIHSPDEWVDTQTLVPAAKTVVALIAEYAENLG